MRKKQKEIIIKNLEEVIGVKTGNSVKGKGIEIFGSDKFYGYLAVSKYDAKDITSMHQLVKDVNTLMGYKTSEQVLDSSYDEFDEDITFKGDGECSTGGYYSKYSDHCHVHGGLSVMNPDWNAVVKVDGTLSNYNDGVVDDFWRDGLECEKSWLEEIDPKGNIAVYHRKGKDWYIGYTLHTEEYQLLYLYEGEEESEYALFQYYKEDKELHSQIVESIRGLVKDCEVKGYAYNELRERNFYSSSDSVWNDNDDIFNLDLIDVAFNSERTEFASLLFDLVNWDEVTDDRKSPARAVKRAYDKWIEKYIVGKADNGRFEEFKDLIADSGYTLTKTPIPQTDHEQKCVAYKNEEYHFFLGELYGADSASAFFGKIQAALAKRLMEKLEHTALIQKSVNVFVGFNDSIESGNCKSGTEEFCHRHHIDTSRIGGVRGDELLRMEFTNFTRRAVMQAVVKHEGLAC